MLLARGLRLILTAAAAWILTGALASAGGSVTVTFWHGMSGVLHPVVNELTEDFNRLNPGIVVQAQFQGDYGMLNQKLGAAIAAGHPPTLAQVFPAWTDQLIRANALTPMERLIRGPDGLDETQRNDIFPVLRQANTFGGVMWTMPFSKSVYLLFYNADLLNEHNLPVPRTWDELITVAKALTKVDGDRVSRYGFVVRPTTGYFATMLLTNGGEFLKPGGREVAFNGPAGVATLQFLVELVNKHNVAYVRPELVETDFGAGKVAMYLAVNPALTFAKAAAGGKFSVGLAPPPYRTRPATLVTGTDLAIMGKTTTPQQAAAWKYIKFITGTTGTARWSLRTLDLPVRQSGRDSTLMKVYVRDNPEHKAGLGVIEFARAEPGMAAWSEIRDILQDAIEQVMLGKLTPQQGLDQAAIRANRLLAEQP